MAVSAVAVEGAEFLARLDAPHVDPMARSGNCVPPIRRHGHRPDPVLMTSEGAEFTPALEVPHFERLVIGSGHGLLPIWRHGHRRDHVAVALEGAGHRPARKVLSLARQCVVTVPAPLP